MDDHASVSARIFLGVVGPLALMAVGACHARHEDARAPDHASAAGVVDGGVLAAHRDDESASGVDASVDAAAAPLTVAQATAMLKVRDEPLRLAHGGDLHGPCVDWTRRVERVELGEDPGHEEAGAADAAQANLVTAERVSGAHFDVDGDGVDDVTVAAGAVGMTRLQEVFVVRGGCGYSVGMFESTAQLEVRRHASRGLFDLVTNESLPSPSGVTYEVTYRFNGRAYRPIGRRRMKEPDRRSEDYLQ